MRLFQAFDGSAHLVDHVPRNRVVESLIRLESLTCQFLVQGEDSTIDDTAKLHAPFISDPTSIELAGRCIKGMQNIPLASIWRELSARARLKREIVPP